LDACQRIEELLKPDGEVIGERPRAKSMVRRVTGGAEEARDLFESLAKLGWDAPVEEPSHGSNPGRLVEISDLGYVGYRETPTPTIDVNVSIEGLRNVKFKFIGGAGA
jgi:hypothetical protein